LPAFIFAGILSILLSVRVTEIGGNLALHLYVFQYDNQLLALSERHVKR